MGHWIMYLDLLKKFSLIFRLIKILLWIAFLMDTPHNKLPTITLQDDFYKNISKFYLKSIKFLFYYILNVKFIFLFFLD